MKNCFIVVLLLAPNCVKAQESLVRFDQTNQTVLWSDQLVESGADIPREFGWEDPIQWSGWFDNFDLESISQYSAPSVQQKVTTTVKGTVKWPDGGGASGATVKIRFQDQEVARVYSHQDGSYESSFTSMPITGRLTVAVSHPGDITHNRGTGYTNKDIHTGFITMMDVGLLGPGLLKYRIHNLNPHTSLPEGAKIRLRVYPGSCSWDDIRSGRVGQIGYYETGLEQDVEIVVQLSPITILVVLPRVNGLHWENQNGDRVESLIGVYSIGPCQKTRTTLSIHLLLGG